jgi:hypothetical protein
MLGTPLLLDTHATRPPLGAAVRSVGNGVTISVSMLTAAGACAEGCATESTATATKVRRTAFFMMFSSTRYRPK